MTDRPLLVVVFLRGGADGLSLVPPYGDPAYANARPTLAIPPPDQDGGALDLDGRFGLHPALAALHGLYEAGSLSVVHAVGTDDQTRSHFDAQDRLERAGASDGWLARYLRTRPGPPPGPLDAVALGPQLPLSLHGVGAAALARLEDSLLDVTPPYRRAMASLWAGEDDLSRAGRRSLQAEERLREAAREPVEGFPDSAFGRALADLVRLARADVGLEVAHIDHGGWDSHFVQAALLDSQATDLASGLAALPAGLGDAWSRTLVLVVTEFGRRVYENTSLGTDHGRAGAAFALGGAMRGGRLVADWPGLGEPDLRVTTDIRSLLAAALDHLGHPDRSQVLPGFESPAIPLFGG